MERTPAKGTVFLNRLLAIMIRPMKACATLLVALGLVANGAFAAGPKPKVCFTKAEENAEQIVRDGLRLREGATACDDRPWDMHTQPLWDQVETKFGARFKQQTDIRRKAFLREFSKDVENRIQAWDGRTVLYFRNYPLSVPYCTELKQNLDDLLKKGWATFVARARLYRIPVEDDYKPCG
jgi:hypothetical protein